MAKGLEVDWVVIRVNTIRWLLAVFAFAVVAVGLTAFIYFYTKPAPETKARREIERAIAARSQVEESEVAGRRSQEMVEATAKLTQAEDAYADEAWDAAFEHAHDAKRVFLELLEGSGAEPAGAASVVSTNGRVRVQRAGTRAWIDASDGMRLENGDVVQSGNGTAEIELGDGTKFSIEPDTQLEVYQESRTSKSRGTVISGELNILTADAESMVKTFNNEASIAADSRITVIVEKDDEATFRVLDGGATVTNPGGEQMLIGVGEQIIADASGELSDTMVTPEPPLPFGPRNNRVFDIADNPIIELTWQSGQAQLVYLQVSRSPSFFKDQLEVDNKLAQTDSARIQAVNTGTYHWRLAAGTEERRESVWSPPMMFQIIDPSGRRSDADREPPALRLTRTQQLGSLFIIEGTTEVGAMVTINGERAEVGSGGQFRKAVEVTTQGRSELVIIASDASGNSTRLTHPVVVEP